jgi:hypothetical protein
VRRSSFKNAVNANDITRFGADLGGVQQYTLNGNKIIYLARETSAKKTGNGAPPPASCTVDGRAMMDKNSLYCSLMCKMQAEDPGGLSCLVCQCARLGAWGGGLWQRVGAVPPSKRCAHVQGVGQAVRVSPVRAASIAGLIQLVWKSVRAVQWLRAGA